MTRVRILPYKQGSKSAKALATELGGKVLKLEGSKFKPKLGDLIINWGRSDGYPVGVFGVLHLPVCKFLNEPEDIGTASNKLDFFQTMKEKAPEVIPQFWTNKHDIPSDVYPIVCRTLLSGHSGQGIVIADDSDGVVDAQLYVKYEKKKDEYRVHIGRNSGGIVEIAVQRKAIPSGTTPKNWQVRNLDNGFIYVRNNVNPPKAVLDAARKCFEASDLDFGAIDVIWNETQEKAYVLEINTAPGLEGQTVTDYAEFFRGLV